MREIKFRAWVKGFLPEQSGMFYGIDLLRNTVSGGYDRIGVWRNNNHYKFKSEEEPFTLMQYTGLKDKNGTEIYEGDILKGPKRYGAGFSRKPSTESTFEVKVHTQGWGDSFYLIELTQTPAGYRTYPIFTECEVIGNIYESPELLQQ